MANYRELTEAEIESKKIIYCVEDGRACFSTRKQAEAYCEEHGIVGYYKSTKDRFGTWNDE